MVGRIESLWRYPVKSMRGEELSQAYLGFGGVYGDRRYAFLSSAAPDDFPFMTSRQKHEMLLHRARYRHPEHMHQPELRTNGKFTAVEIETPAGERLAVDDPRLIELLRVGLRERHELTMIESDVAIVDSRPISLFSLQTARQLSEEVGIELDKRRFRANIFVELETGAGFGEDSLVGRELAIGPNVIVQVLKRNARCKIITLDPDSAKAAPHVMKCVARDHDSCAGIYAAVLREGLVSPGDVICLVDG